MVYCVMLLGIALLAPTDEMTIYKNTKKLEITKAIVISGNVDLKQISSTRIPAAAHASAITNRISTVFSRVSVAPTSNATHARAVRHSEVMHAWRMTLGRERTEPVTSFLQSPEHRGSVASCVSFHRGSCLGSLPDCDDAERPSEAG